MAKPAEIKKERTIMSVKEKVAYLSGLLDGLAYNKDSNEGKMFYGILEALDEIADEIEDIKDDLDELEDFVEALDEDLEELEDILDMDEDEEDDDDELVSLKCPSCGRMNMIEPEILWESDEEVEVLCSNCGAVIFTCDECDECDEDDEDDEDEEDDED